MNRKEKREELTLSISVRMGGTLHTDFFAVTLYADLAGQKGRIAVLDTAGELQRKLNALGYTAVSWDQTALPEEKLPLVISGSEFSPHFPDVRTHPGLLQMRKCVMPGEPKHKSTLF